eukprot:Selendium_serpulae@DN11206_c0_g1_i1.p1
MDGQKSQAEKALVESQRKLNPCEDKSSRQQTQESFADEDLHATDSTVASIGEYGANGCPVIASKIQGEKGADANLVGTHSGDGFSTKRRLIDSSFSELRQTIAAGRRKRPCRVFSTGRQAGTNEHFVVQHTKLC